MIRVLKDHRLTFLLYGCFLCAGILLVAAVPKLELHMWINSQHSVFSDTVFTFLTLLGDGWFAVILAGIIAYQLIPNFGPMRKAEMRAFKTGKLIRDGSNPLTNMESMEATGKSSLRVYLLIDLIAPILILASTAACQTLRSAVL